MTLQEFIARYCTPTRHVRPGLCNDYQVYLTSPAAILSNMHSADSQCTYTDLDYSWERVFCSKRQDNEWRIEGGTSPLQYLAEEGFRTPLCILVSDGHIESFHNGNHRLAAAIDLGFERVPVVFVDKYTDESEDRWEVTEIRHMSHYGVLVPPPAVALA